MNNNQREQMNRIKQRREQAERNSRERAMRREQEEEKAQESKLSAFEIFEKIVVTAMGVALFPCVILFYVSFSLFSIALKIIMKCLSNRYFALIAITVIFVLLKINQGSTY